MEIKVRSPFPPEAVPRIWIWMRQFWRRVSDDFGPKTLAEFVAQWEATQQQTWAVYRDGELGGMASFTPWSPIVGTLHTVFKRAFWGRSTTETALRMVVDQIFGQGYEKILCLPFEDNHAIIALAKRIGFRREGVLRAQTRRDGKPVNLVAIGLTREEYYAGSSGDSGADRSRDGSRRTGEPAEDGENEQHAHLEPGGRSLSGATPDAPGANDLGPGSGVATAPDGGDQRD